MKWASSRKSLRTRHDMDYPLWSTHVHWADFRHYHCGASLYWCTALHTGNFFELNLTSSENDCIYLDQVLEHLKNPQDYLNEFQRILKPGGILFIASPNIKSFSSQFKIIFGKLGLKKQRGRHYDTWHHMFYYNPTELSKLLENKFGFECQLKGNDVFVLPESSSFRKGFIRIMTILPIIWRSTFYLIAKKK